MCHRFLIIIKGLHCGHRQRPILFQMKLYNAFKPLDDELFNDKISQVIGNGWQIRGHDSGGLAGQSGVPWLLNPLSGGPDDGKETEQKRFFENGRLRRDNDGRRRFDSFGWQRVGIGKGTEIK
ncbi:MAG: hypothetical protein A2091_03045 [Desulfuromonadales bacterium GWD2_61_12]|nr:MAG: hypothetical protein A2091_03045 [Desulfuromonadales bacterium GWD2_61_12]